MNNDVFKRVEQKYVLNEEMYHKLWNKIKNKFQEDTYFAYSICNIYFDTANFELINTSIEKPPYKEKVRLRSYGNPTLENKVFLEIKKKFKGTVNKRRIVAPLKAIYDYLDKNILPVNNQIMREIDYCFKRYNLKPALYLAYDRYAYKAIDDEFFRITFDYNIRSRENDLHIENDKNTQLLFTENIYIMEVKINGAMPLWFSKILTDLKIYPTSFSKYGNIYKQSLRKDDD